MIYPKLQATQELALHRVAVQQHGFVSPFASANTNTAVNGANATNSSSNVSVASGAFPRAPPTRSELTLPSVLGSAAAVVSPFSSSRNDTPSLGPITGGGTNSTAPATIARPGTRVRPEWVTALDDIDPFFLPEHQLHGSQPSTRRCVTAHYIADQYDCQWLARRTATTATGTSNRKGKGGSIESAVASFLPVSSLPTSSQHNISLSFFEDLITAFELGSYHNPEIPIQRQPVSSFESVLATGANGLIVDEVRQYWLGKRQALGGNVPCIPSLRMNVREDNQTTLCHSDLLQYCPLPFNHRDWSIAAVQRRVPQSQEGNLKKETVNEVKEKEGTVLLGQKRRRQDVDTPTTDEKSYAGTTEEEEAAERKELRALLSSGLNVARALLEREECKLAHTHLTIYELAILRRTAILGRASPDGGPTLSVPMPWASDEALQEDWVPDDEATEEFHDGVSGGCVSAAVESVIALDKRL